MLTLCFHQISGEIPKRGRVVSLSWTKSNEGHSLGQEHVHPAMFVCWSVVRQLAANTQNTTFISICYTTICICVEPTETIIYEHQSLQASRQMVHTFFCRDLCSRGTQAAEVLPLLQGEEQRGCVLRSDTAIWHAVAQRLDLEGGDGVGGRTLLHI